MVWYNRLVEDAVGPRGVLDKWVDRSGLNATPQPYGYGRYFRFSGMSQASSLWFGVNHERWAGSGDTPLWLRVGDRVDVNVDEIGRKLSLQVHDRWVPIHPKQGVEYPEVLEDVAS